MDASLIRKERRDLLPRVDTNPPDDWRGNEDVWQWCFGEQKRVKGYLAPRWYWPSAWVTVAGEALFLALTEFGPVKAGSFKMFPAREVFSAAGLEKPKGLPWDLTVRRQPME